jgi:hypothetical protein
MLAAPLAQVRPDAWGLLLGSVPTEIRGELTARKLLPFNPALVDLQIQGNQPVSLAMDVSLGEDQGESFKAKVSEWKHRQLAALDDVPHLRADPESVESLQRALQSIQVNTSDIRPQIVGGSQVVNGKPQGSVPGFRPGREPFPSPTQGGALTRALWGGVWSSTRGPFRVTITVPAEALAPFWELLSQLPGVGN